MLNLRLLITVVLMSLCHFSSANELLSSLVESEYSGPSVEDNILLMDTDKNGYVDVFEMHAFLEKMHGKDYKKTLFDKWESSVGGNSCSSPFSKQFYLK